MDINDDVMNMPKGWIVHYDNGTIVTEYDRNGNQTDWRSVPKTGIKSLSLKWNNKHWTIAGKDIYLQKKRGWVVPHSGVNQHPTIECRYIGYWEGNDKIYYEVNEHTGRMRMVVETLEGAKG